MEQDYLLERVAKLETKVESHERTIHAQTEKNELLIKLTALTEMQVDVNKEQNEQMKKFGETLNRVDENLTNLNTSQQQLNTNQQKLGERVSDIEETLQDQKVDVVGLIKKIFTFVLTGVGTLALGYFAVKFGLK